MRKWTLLLFVLAVLASGFAPAPFPRSRGSKKDDLKQLQGEWVLVGHKSEGRDVSFARWRVVIEGNRLNYCLGAQVIREWIIRVDSSRKPAALDSRDKSGGSLHRGIYRLEGDTLTICSCPGDRPADFDSTGKGRHLMTYKRPGR